ncbi:hypothetical protein [Aquimarina addita]
MARGIWVIITCVVFASCTDTNILFTTDFEDQHIGESPGFPWTKIGRGIVVIDTTKSYSGNQSVHFTTGEGYEQGALIGIDHIFPLPKNSYYGSMYMYVQEASPDGIHWTMIQSSGKVPNQNFSSEIRYGGQHNKKLMANYDTKGVKSDCWQHSEEKIPEKKWFRVQWFFDGTQDHMKLWLDGTLIEAITVKKEGAGCVSDEIANQWKFPLIENVFLGWVDYQTGGGPREVWIDDVIISTKKL